jgi:hypothetical protein
VCSGSNRQHWQWTGGLPRCGSRGNAARHEAALISPESELGLLARLDRELGQLLEAQCLSGGIRASSDVNAHSPGERAYDYVGPARSTANEKATDLPSIWSWANDMKEATRAPDARRDEVPRDPRHGIAVGAESAHAASG